MTVFYQDPAVQLLQGDILEMLKTLPDEYVQTVITSPPYWGLRNYNVKGQIGLETTPAEYLDKMVVIFREMRRVLKNDGTLWLNLGDCYATGAGKVGEHPGGGQRGARWTGEVSRVRDVKRGYRTDRLANGHGDVTARKAMGPMTQPNRMPIEGLKPKDMVGMPWRVAFALQADGWYLRSDIIWSKTNPMPESVTDRPTKAHEYLFLLAKNGGKPLWWRAVDTMEWSQHPDLKEKVLNLDGEPVPRWQGFDYYYDAEAIKEPATYSEEAKYDPGTNGLGGADRKTGKTTRRFAKPVGWSEEDGAHNKKTGRYVGKKFNGMSRDNSNLAHWKGSVPGRNGGPGQDRRQQRDLKTLSETQSNLRKRRDTDRGLGEKLTQADEGTVRGATGTRFGRGAGWRDDPSNSVLMRNKRSVWTIGTEPYAGTHFATFPEKLIEPCILACAPEGGLVLDPFAGAGTTLLVAKKLNRKALGIELSEESCAMIAKRLQLEPARLL